MAVNEESKTDPTAEPGHKGKRFALPAVFSKLWVRIATAVGLLALIAIIVSVVCWATLIRPKEHAATGFASQGPNIVMILTDDQDLHLDSLEHMPLLKQHMREQGTEFKRHYCTVSICCPSRVTIWTGQHAHNHGVTDVVGHWGGWPRFKERELNDKYLPVWLQDSGYHTYYTGKLFNDHSTSNYKNPYPAGWTASDFLLDPSTYRYKYPLFQRNAPDPDDPSKLVHHDVWDPTENRTKSAYSTTIIQEKGYGFLADGAKSYEKNGIPFFLAIAPIAPHADLRTGGFLSPIPERQADLDKFANVTVPRLDWFNPDKPSGVSWTYQLEKLDAGNETYLDEFYRARLASLQAVDRLVANITTSIENLGIADNTYIIYTTDNGYHVGQHRLQPGKNCPFETDINIPLIIRGPGVAKNVTSSAVSSHTDMAPTIFHMVNRTKDPGFDGKPIQYKAGTSLNVNDTSASTLPTQPDHVNVEFWGAWRPEGELGQNRSNQVALNFSKYGRSATYKAIRVIGTDYDLYYSTWCSATSETGIEHEMYDMTKDPQQLSNMLRHPNGTLLGINSTYLEKLSVLAGKQEHAVPALWKRLDALTFVLKTCKGESCRDPWGALLPAQNVTTLGDALAYNETFFDEMRAHGNTVSFQLTKEGTCIEGPLLMKGDGNGDMWTGELPVFESYQKLFERDGISWDEWT